MAKKKGMKGMKVVLYSLGLGFLGVGAFMSHGALAQAPMTKQKLSPAEKSMQQKPGTTKSRVTSAQMNTSYRANHRKTVNKLSKKNQTVFHSLSDNDQQRVVEAHKNGKHPQKELTNVLNEDQKQHQKSQNIYD